MYRSPRYYHIEINNCLYRVLVKLTVNEYSILTLIKKIEIQLENKKQLHDREKEILAARYNTDKLKKAGLKYAAEMH